MILLTDLLVLGSGSAGLLAALALKRQLPQSTVRVVRSPDIGVIGVGESTTPNVPVFLFDFLGLNPRTFFELAEPTWKLGIHFLWGPRESFEYSFAPALDARLSNLPLPNGYYCCDNFNDVNLGGALMRAQKAFARRPDGAGPLIDHNHAFHLENVKFVRALEFFAIGAGIEFIDGKVLETLRDGETVTAVILEDGRRLHADFFIDASGFRSELLGKALHEPFMSFDKQLFNDRAVLGAWNRTDEPTLPYTTAETMDAGWAWRIDHERVIHRGYVFSAAHLSDDAARAEMGAKNPRANIWDHVVKFRTGRHARSWVGNVLAVGNAYAFVEPLEATAIMMICAQLKNFLEFVQPAGPTGSMRDLYNKLHAEQWDEIRDFLTMHYHFNTRLNTPYWQRCRAETDLSNLEEFLSVYRENGPIGFNRYNLKATASQFGLEGFLAILIGNQVPFKCQPRPDSEHRLFNAVRARNRAMAQGGFSVEEALAFTRHPDWRWAGEAPAAQKREMSMNHQ